MRRLLLLAFLTPLAACVVVPVADGPRPPPRVVAPPPDPQPEPAPVVWYYGPHYVPDALGGGWCDEDEAHTHDYFPDRPDVYVVDRGYYTYRGPNVFTYYAGHPLPGGGWCGIVGPHTHDYYPPRRVGFFFRPGRGFVYEGEYHASRPPPPAFWERPSVVFRPPPSRLPAAPPPGPYRRPLPRTVTPPPPARVDDRHDRVDDRRDDRRDRVDDRRDDRRDRVDDRRDDRPDGKDRVRAPAPDDRPVRANPPPVVPAREERRRDDPRAGRPDDRRLPNAGRVDTRPVREEIADKKKDKKKDEPVKGDKDRPAPRTQVH
jgi:hypothetical protein